jgi:hypothetical protein
MAIDKALAELNADRRRLVGELERVNKAIQALTGATAKPQPVAKHPARHGQPAESKAAASKNNKRGRPKGRPVSEETRAKMRAAWARRKALQAQAAETPAAAQPAET